MTAGAQGALLFVANFPADTGYAWDAIEELFAHIADHVAAHGVRTFVAYPSISEAPRSLERSAAEPVVLDASLDTEASVLATERFIRREAVRVLYLTDRPARSAIYRRLRRAGLNRIIVHDRTSGAWTRPRGLKRAAKWVAARVPGHSADVVVAVSDYVARRQLDVAMVPADRVRRVWNGLSLPNLETGGRKHLLDIMPTGLDANRPIIACAGRAVREKGVEYLMRAFDEVRRGYQGAFPPTLVYIGDGPALADFRALREVLASRQDIVLAGYRPTASALLGAADICVVPSVWEEAFGRTVLEGMVRARPVIGTKVGGIPELIEDGVSGILVPPADPAALARALERLLADPDLRSRLGAAARKRACELFTQNEQIDALVQLVEAGLR